MPQQLWYVGTVLILSACFAVWFSFLYLPLERLHLQLRNEYRELIDQQTSTQSLEQEVIQLQQTIDSLSMTLKTQVLDYPSPKICLNLLMARSVESGLSLLSWITKPATTKEWYLAHPVEFELQGTFDQLLSFTLIFSSARYPIQLHELKIHHHETNILKISCFVSVLEVNSHASAL